MPWKRAKRVGVPVRIGLQHLIASSSIPFIFPAIRVNREYFGDGSMRQVAPLSPALHLGAERVLIIGVNEKEDEPCERQKVTSYPPSAEIAGHILNSIFIDNLDVDLERLQRINQTISLIPAAHKESTSSLRPVQSMIIRPSQKVAECAQLHANGLPRVIRYLYHAIGAMGPNGAAMLSYLLFEAAYCQALIDMGYRDALRQRDEILAFLFDE